MTHSFPKIIWQTHDYKKEWRPEYMCQIAQTWISLNPGWEYRYVDQVERSETVKRYPEIYKIYKYMSPVVQSDIWRFIITYEEGGCYNDMDSVCYKPLDYMLQGIQGDPEMVTVPIKGKTGNTHNYIVKARSPIMKAVVDKMIEGNGWIETKITYHNRPPKEVPNTTYPFDIFTETAYSYPNVSKEFDAAFHGIDYKRSFRYRDHKVNYYGQEMSYLEFLKQNGLDLV